MIKKDRTKEIAAFERILDIMDELRVKCPWDRKQTYESLRPLTIEETYELSDAIMNNDTANISKELGDILLHIIFYSKIGEENGTYTITDVINNLCDKLIYRHPHVFSTAEVESAEQVIENWEQLKTKEKDGNKRVLSGVPETLPSIIKAYRMQDKARAVGFDWQEKSQVWDKVEEELGEFKVELKSLLAELDKSSAELDKSSAELKAKEKYALLAEKELGDFLFSIINAARLYDINPDTALEQTCKKFRSRFTYLEEQTIRKGRSLKEMSLDEMDVFWNEAKAIERAKESNEN